MCRNRQQGSGVCEKLIQTFYFTGPVTTKITQGHSISQCDLILFALFGNQDGRYLCASSIVALLYGRKSSTPIGVNAKVLFVSELYITFCGVSPNCDTLGWCRDQKHTRAILGWTDSYLEKHPTNFWLPTRVCFGEPGRLEAKMCWFALGVSKPLLVWFLSKCKGKPAIHGSAMSSDVAPFARGSCWASIPWGPQVFRTRPKL